MKRNIILISLMLAVVLSFTACDQIVVAKDNSVHTANFYFYNYTNQEFYAKLIPNEFRGKQKFRIQKTKYISPKADDEKITEPDFSFEWIPGDFYLNLTQGKSEEYDADLKFFTSKKNELKIEGVDYYPGVPSAQDYWGRFYLVETFCKKKLAAEEYTQYLSTITDQEDKELFEAFYQWNFSSENPLYQIIISSLMKDGLPLEKAIDKKNFIREIETIYEKYDLPKGETIVFLFTEEETGDLDYELVDDISGQDDHNN